MSRNYNTEYWKTLYESISCSVVQLSVCKKEGGKFVPKQFGTGIVLCDAPGCVAVLTTVTCEYEEDDKKSGGKKIVKDHVFVQLGDSERRAHIYASGSIVNILLLPITDPYKNKFVLLDDESFYETDIYKSEPVWVAGCFSESLKQVMPSGYVSACDAEKLVHGEIVQTFVHSCPIVEMVLLEPPS